MFIRTDIPIHAQLVQTGHACLEAGFSFERPASNTHLILFQIKNEEELLNASSYLTENNIRHEMFLNLIMIWDILLFAQSRFLVNIEINLGDINYGP